MIKYLYLNDKQKRSLERNIDDLYEAEGIVINCEVISVKHSKDEYQVCFCYDGPKNEFRQGTIWCNFCLEKNSISDFEECIDVAFN